MSRAAVFVCRLFPSLVPNTCAVEFRGATTRPAMTRKMVALVSSANLRDWRVEHVLPQHKDVRTGGFQHADWVFDGDDIIAAGRLAFSDGGGGPHDQHGANYLTFRRFPDFARKL